MQAKTSILAVTTIGFVLGGVAFKRARPASLLVVEHTAAAFERRAGDLTANVCGRYRGETPLSYRLNAGAWRQLDGSPGSRFPGDRFTIELTADELADGGNRLELLASDGRREFRSFDYSAAEISLPRTVDWAFSDLDVQDGAWERIRRGDEVCVRPRPGTEDYDRILNVTGALRGARRVTCDVTFRSQSHDGRLFGFGVLPLWGGHAEASDDVRPRRGWRYGAAWYYSKQGGVGVETSERLGDAAYSAAVSYETRSVEPDTTYRIVTEAWPDGDGWLLRMKWWAPDRGAEPSTWIELRESGDRLSRDAETAVALVAHRCQVEFGAVTVTRP